MALVPEESGEFAVPGLSLSYFDPKTETYKDMSLSPHKVSVLPGSQESTNSMLALGNPWVATQTMLQLFVQPAPLLELWEPT